MSSVRPVKKRDQRHLVRPRRDSDVAGPGGGERLGDLRRQAEMAHGESLIEQPGRSGAGEVILGAAFGKVQHRVDLVALQSRDQFGRETAR